MKAYGELIQRTRERMGYRSQGDIGKALGKTQTQMSRIESGTAANMLPPEDVHRIRDVLGISVVQQLVTAGYRLEGQLEVVDDDLSEIADLAKLVDWKADPSRLQVIFAIMETWSRYDRNSLQQIADAKAEYT